MGWGLEMKGIGFTVGCVGVRKYPCFFLCKLLMCFPPHFEVQSLVSVGTLCPFGRVIFFKVSKDNEI